MCVVDAERYPWSPAPAHDACARAADDSYWAPAAPPLSAGGSNAPELPLVARFAAAGVVGSVKFSPFMGKPDSQRRRWGLRTVQFSIARTQYRTQTGAAWFL